MNLDDKSVLTRGIVSKPINGFNVVIFIYIFTGIISSFHLLTTFNLFNFSTFIELWLSLIYGYWIAFSFIIVQIGLGGLILRFSILRNSDLSGVPFLIFSFGAGFYISNCMLTFLAIFKWMNGFGIFFYLLLSIPTLILGFKAIYDSIFIYGETEKNISNFSQRRKWMPWAIVFIILIWISPYFIQTLLPNTDWDGAWQHLPLPKLFLKQGISWVTPSFMQYDFPGAVHLVYSLFFFLKAETAITPFNFLIALGIVFSVYHFSNHFFGRITALWATSITVAINIMWEVSLTPRIDSFLTFFCLLAVYAFLLWIQDNKKAGLLIITGMMLGMALGTKYTATIFVFALVLLGVYHFLLTSKMNSINNMLLLLMVLTTVLIPSGWWYARNAVKLHDPLYPYLSETISHDGNGNSADYYSTLRKQLESMPHREDIKAVFNKTGLNVFTTWEDGSDRTPRRSVLTQWRKGLFNLWDIFMNPDKYARKPYHEINPFLFLFIALPFFDRSRISLYLYAIIGFCFVLIASKSYILRYALPVFPIMSIGASRVLSHIRLKKLMYVVAILLAACVMRFGFYETKKVIEMNPLPFLSGKENRIDWLIRVGYNWDRTTPPFIKFVNEQIDMGLMSKEDIIFMIGEGKGNLLKCKYLPDSSRNTHPWLGELIKSNNEYLEILKSLKERGINYFAINYFYLYWAFKNSHYDKKPLIFGLYHLQQFLETYTEIIYNNNGMVLAKIK